MQQFKVPYGFKQFNFSNVVVFTGKIRIKSNREYLVHKLQNWTEHLSFNESLSKKNWFTTYTTIEFSVTNNILNRQLINAIRSVMREIAHTRIDQKYGDCVQFERMEDIDCILPF